MSSLKRFLQIKQASDLFTFDIYNIDDEINNIFGICSDDGTVRTFFKPETGIDYFKNEIISDFPINGEKAFNEMLNIILIP